MICNTAKRLDLMFGALALALAMTLKTAEAATSKTQERGPVSQTKSQAASENRTPTAAQLPGFKFEESDGTVEFLAIGNPGALRVKGTGKGPVGSASVEGGKLNVNFEMDLRSLKTGIDLRDSHMKEKYLLTGTHPKAKLSIKDFTLPAGASEPGEASFDVPGQLTLKGVTKSIICKITAQRSSKAAKFEAQFRVKLEDFGIDIPKYLGITIAENVDLTVKAESNALQQ
jgi:polyisoprenoid-binding protein YceI